MTLYIDVIYGLNTVVTASLLYMTGKWQGYEFSLFRVLIVALVTSLPLFLWLTDYGAMLLHPVSQVIVCICTVYLAFGFKRFARFIKTTFTFYVISLLSGGAVIAMTWFWQSSQLLHTWKQTSSWATLDHMHGLLVLSTLPVVILLTQITKHSLKEEKRNENKIINVRIQMDGMVDSVYAKALIDTGNHLKDPITRKPVMVATLSVLESVLSNESLENFSTWLNAEGTEGENPWNENVRIIPYQAIGKEHGFLFAIQATEIEMVVSGESSHILNRALIAFETRAVSSEDRFQCIIPPEMVPAE
ncbi:hypothetical protein DH09_04280 [Bacillaceae bacterium JMAK1]|nr:hypothetical protein DH09_04280 [Bacillaceae bacterium JMAK1]